MLKLRSGPRLPNESIGRWAVLKFLRISSRAQMRPAAIATGGVIAA
jgi:hypothetical protein